MNLSFAPDIKEYLYSQSESYGMSVSAYLTMLVCNHRKESEAMATMGNMTQMIEKIESFIEQHGNLNLPSEIKASDVNVDSIAEVDTSVCN